MNKHSEVCGCSDPVHEAEWDRTALVEWVRGELEEVDPHFFARHPTLLSALAETVARWIKGLQGDLVEIEGNLLYCPPATCGNCIGGHRCDFIPTCEVRQMSHAQAVARTRKTLTDLPWRKIAPRG